MKKFKIAVCQNKPVKNKDKSVAQIISKIEEAKAKGADLVVLPEIFYHPYELKALPRLEESNGETLGQLQTTAKRLEIYLCTGSMVERVENKRFNKSYLIDPSGKIILEHCKAHMFDVDFETLRTRESLIFDAGDGFAIAKTELGKVGMLICYDIRFPEAARKLALMGAEIILVPAAFNNITGPLHWHILFQGRAIENQVFIVAASPACDMKSRYHAYGHSMVVDPWGKILTEADDSECTLFTEIDPEVLDEAREKLPMLKHRRPEIY